MLSKDKIHTLCKLLEEVVGKENILSGEADLVTHSYDSGIPMALPELVVFPNLIRQISPIVKILSNEKVPFLVRMSGTNVTGGVVPLHGGVVINMSRLNKVIAINTSKRTVVVEPGIRNADLQKILRPFGYFFAPNPTSASMCTIGGNIAENASGPNRIRYGATGDNIIRLEVVTPDGETHLWAPDGSGPCIAKMLNASEGTLGIITRAWLRIMPIPEYTKTLAIAFEDISQAISASEQIIKACIPLRAVEIVDKTALDTTLKDKNFTFPSSIHALMLAEPDGKNKKEVENNAEKINQICIDNSSLACEEAIEHDERIKLWSIRNDVFPALTKYAPDLAIEELCVPRSVLLDEVNNVKKTLRSYRLTSALIISPSTGTVCPHIVFDKRNVQDIRRVKSARAELVTDCINLGGFIGGSYGIGIDNRLALKRLYNPKVIASLYKIKSAFDKKNLLNPDKILPVNDDSELFEASNNKRNSAELSANAHTLLISLRNRYEQKIKSAVCGSATQMEVPAETDSLKILNTSFLVSEPILNEGNLTVKVDAGTDIIYLRRFLKEKNMELQMPETRGTLGGIIASGRTPDITKLLLGMEIATAKGEYLNFSHQTLAAAHGYDICSLFCGSRGAYGIILSVVLRICPLAEKREFPKLPPADFKTDYIYAEIKKAFDPENLLNPWIYNTAEENYQ